jgi:hypothetical protein
MKVFEFLFTLQVKIDALFRFDENNGLGYNLGVF